MLARPRLSARLSDALRLGRKLTLISAPAGFGKTTVLAQGLGGARSGLGSAAPNLDRPSPIAQSVAWLSLDADDNDPARFWSYVIAALEIMRPGIGTQARMALAAPPPVSINAILTTLTNDWVAAAPQGQLVVLALDDYHVITTPAIHDGLVFLIDHLPPELQLVITSRVDPPLPLARWRARGELAELRAADLRFTPDEAATFLTTIMHLPLEAAGVAALEARTEGWAAGLQLAALALRDRTDGGEFIRAFADSNRFAIEYLAEEVFARQPAHLQRFLLRTAILDRMCGPLCDELLGITDQDSDSARSRPHVSQQAYSQLLLRQLERLNLFVIPLDNQQHWYRYHHLFAEMLRGRLLAGTTAAELARLHHRASTWFEQNGLLPEAISQALTAQDDQRAASLIEQNSEAMLKRGEHRTLQSWIDRLPADLVRSRPWLCVVRAAIMLVAHQLELAEACLADATRAVDSADQAQRERLLSEIALQQAVIAHRRQEFSRATTLAREALQLIPAGDLLVRGRAMLILGNASYWDGQGVAASASFAEAGQLAIAAGDIHTALNAISNQGIMLSLNGQLHQAAATYRQGLHLASAHHAQQMPITCLLHANLADLLYEWNDLEALSPHLNQAIELGDQSMNPHLMLTNQIYLIRLYQARGDSRAALGALSRALGGMHNQHRSPTLSADLAVCQARLWLAQGNIAPRWRGRNPAG
jgi:LuxR family transcriptional regulator, maltose regulon positive regulatory protein